MTEKKAPTKILAYDHEDREPPVPAREFKPCSTCRYKFVFGDTGSAGCSMFGNHHLPTAREKFCGKFGDAWRAHMPSVYAAWPMYDRIMG